MKVHKILGINLGLTTNKFGRESAKYVGIFSHIFLCWRHIILHCPSYHVKSKHYMISQYDDIAYPYKYVIHADADNLMDNSNEIIQAQFFKAV